MHTLDIFFIIASVFFIVVGIRRGLIGELFRLIALIAAFFVAFLYYPELAKLCRFNPPYLAGSLSFTIIFILTALAIIGIGWLLKKIVHLTPLGWADYFFGGAIGLAKAVLIFWVICLSLASFPPSKFILGLHRSFVFQTYKKLPPAIKLAGVTKIRALFKKNIDHDVPQKLKETKRQMEQLNRKFDSAAAPNIKYR
jgi:uncharacterized membrane protein required for colicin V production